MTPKTCAALLTLTGYGFVVFGLIWVLTGFAAIDAPARVLIDVLDWPLDGLPSAPSQEARWMGAIGAGLTVGLGLIFAFVFSPLIKINNPVVGPIVRRGGLLAMTSWLVIDNSGSISSGVTSNAVFNTVFYLLVAVPLVLVKFSKP